MKKARNIIVLLMLLGAASLAEAQIVISQTTVSTTRVYEKSGREKGWVIRPESEVGIAVLYPCVVLNVQATFGYQFSPSFSMGIGTGVNVNTPASNIFWYLKDPIAALPLFANFRVYFCDRQWSPFFDLKVGFNSSLNKSYDPPLNGGDYDNRYYSMKGLRLTSTLGVQHKKIDFGITVGTYNLYRPHYEYSNVLNLYLTGNIAYSFQFNKK